jgi:hypothetical protein
MKLAEYKSHIEEEYNTYESELETGVFSRTELSAYNKRDFYYKILKGLTACEKHNEARELLYTCRSVKDFNKHEKAMKKQERIAKENLENASEFLN